ncbi:MAG: sialate O-acetylesterase [Planctomycetaceae bacterium]|nr:sialate O-acetylesterase [Planctomycetaceae bacterium]
MTPTFSRYGRVTAVSCLLVFSLCAAAIARLPAPIRVACLGDSITAGARVDARTESYPARLQQLLGDQYDVKNFGLGSATLIKTGRPNVWQKLEVVKEFQPDVAIISLGTNDTVAGKRKNWERIERFEDDFTTLISALAELPTQPRIVLCTPTAMVLETKGLSANRLANLTERKPRLQELCKRIRKLAAEVHEQTGQGPMVCPRARRLVCAYSARLRSP